MTGEDVLRGAELINRWRRLHRLHALGMQRGATLANIAANLRNDDDISGVVCAAALLAYDRRIGELIEAAHAEMAALGISPPFPTETPYE